MSWLQEYGGFLVVIPLLFLLFLAPKLAKKFTRKYQNKLIEDGRDGSEAQVKAQTQAKARTDKAAAESTMHRIVTFTADRDTVVAALTATKLGGGWKSEEPGVWTIAGAKKVNGKHATAATLQDGPTGAQLVLLRAEDMLGIAMAEANWRTLREKVIAATPQLGAAEADGPALERHPVGDVSALSGAQLAAAQHVWLRPGHQI